MRNIGSAAGIASGQNSIMAIENSTRITVIKTTIR